MHRVYTYVVNDTVHGNVLRAAAVEFTVYMDRMYITVVYGLVCSGRVYFSIFDKFV